MSLLCRLKNLVHKGILKEKDLDRIVIIPKEQEPCEDCISRKAVLDLVEDMTDQFGVEHRVITEGVISMLPPVTPKPNTDVLDKIRAEIKEVQTYKMFEGEDTVYVERKDVLAIIDRYTKDGE